MPPPPPARRHPTGLRSGVLPRRDHGGVKLAFDALQVRCDGRRERCSTTLSTAGGYVVAVTTVLSDRSVALASSYLADLTAAQTAVSHLRLVPGRPAPSTSGFWAASPARRTPAAACSITSPSSGISSPS